MGLKVDLAVSRLGRVLCFSRQFLSLRTRAHSAYVFGGNTIAKQTLLLLTGRFTEVTFCLDYSDNRKPTNELHSLTRVQRHFYNKLSKG